MRLPDTVIGGAIQRSALNGSAIDWRLTLAETLGIRLHLTSIDVGQENSPARYLSLVLPEAD